MIERFTKEQFEEALTRVSPFFEELGLEAGEYVYAVPVNSQVRIQIRSSVDASGLAADTGKDSIRIWIQVFQANWQDPSQMVWGSGPKLDAYTTRIPGWQNRLNKKVTELWNMATQLTSPIPSECPYCGRVPFVRFTKKPGKNLGRPWCKCGNPDHQTDKSGGFFQWLDEPISKGTVVKFDEPDQIDLPEIDTPIIIEEKKPEPERTNVEMPDEEDEINLLGMKELLKAKKQDKPEISKSKTGANPSQQAFIEAAIDKNIRLMAPPGSGKTYSIERRVKFLIDQGVKPSEILVVTFSKKMADEMQERIMKTCPSASKDQISTIHAFCFRVLCFWYENSPFYKWSVPKDWQVRKFIEEGIEYYWKSLEHEEKPSWKEVAHWLNISKFKGLKVDESRSFFVNHLGARYGNWLADIRNYVDGKLESQKFLTFSDMLYHMEQMLQNETFRTKLQHKFQHVIIDESQDTNEQSLRILLTVGADPGTNPVYKNGIVS